ncbi:MAG TPA: alpha/beta fold hydrolase [Stellaceae bacterium]|nr:alpha/beta fold hydrolase [Stellaceae bacterium]
MTRRRVIGVTLLLLFLPASFIVGVVASGWLLAAPHQRVVGSAPPDLGADDVVFPSPSGSAIHGWLAPGEPGRGAVLVLHGIRADRGEMVTRLRLLHAAGFGLLAIDLQARGESPGLHITFGHLEALDAAAAVAFLKERLPGERIGVIGVSLGGAATLLGLRPLAVDALVLEQVFPDIDSALTNRLVAYIGPVGRWVARVYEWLMPLMLPIRPEQLRPIDHIGDITAPLLMLAGAEDRYTPLSESRALFARAAEPKQLVEIAGAGHVDLAAHAPEDYRRRVLSFLAEYLSRRD